MKPLISILIAAYNVEKYLINCLETCINQTYENLEIIVVNDGSTDSTLDIIKRYSKQDKRVIEVSKKNGGLVSARISGVENGKGDYFFFLDGDDTLPLSSIESLASKLDRKVDIVVGKYEIIPTSALSFYNSFGFKSGTNLDLMNSMFKNAMCNIVGNLYKKELFQNIDFPIDLYKSLGEDLVTNTQLVYYATNVKYVDKSTYKYHKRNDSLIGEAGKESIWGNAYEAFVTTTNFLKDKDIIYEVRDGYMKLLTTFTLGYLVSSFPIKNYEKDLVDSVDFIHKNWKEFKSSFSKTQVLAFFLAKYSLRLTRFLMKSYLKLK